MTLRDEESFKVIFYHQTYSGKGSVNLCLDVSKYML